MRVMNIVLALAILVAGCGGGSNVGAGFADADAFLDADGRGDVEAAQDGDGPVDDQIPDRVGPSDAAPDGLPEALPDQLPDQLPDLLPDLLADSVPDTLPDTVSEGVPDVLAEAGPDATPDSSPDAALDGMLDALPDALPDVAGELPQDGLSDPGLEAGDGDVAADPGDVDSADALEDVSADEVESPPEPVCGDGKCEAPESEETCCADCGCPAGKGCQNGVCVPVCVPVEEKCNGKDDDCDGQVDETFPELGQACDGADSDQCADGFWLCADDGSKAVCVELAGPWVEACNGKDDDCDGQVDEGGATGCVEYFLDEDGDGFGGAAKACVCAGLPGYTLVSGDCDDTEGAIHPGAVEACNGHDDDCDGKSDPPDSAGCSIYRKDADMDGYGDASDPGLCLCGPDALYKVSNGLDCNDGNNAVKPGALELCDGMDNDCDGQTDPQGTAGCTSYYKDKDGDGYGDKGQGSQCFCQPQGVFNCLNNLDCDDNAFAVKPGVYEVCDGIDNNCDADVDPEGSLDCQFFYKDADNDGKGDLFTAGKCLCSATPPFSVKNQQDCKDTDPLVPSCEGKQCGDNGCGVSCGTCPGAGPCINFKCGNG